MGSIRFSFCLTTKFPQNKSKVGPYEVNRVNLAVSLTDALTSLFKYTKAIKGDKTLVDTLEPFVKEFGITHVLIMARKATVDRAESTRKLAAKLGGASYILKSGYGLPDQGAIGLAAFIDGFITRFENF